MGVKRGTFQRAFSVFILPPASRLLPLFFTPPSPVSLPLSPPPSLPPPVSFFSPCLLSRSSLASRAVGGRQMERPRLFRTLMSVVSCKSLESKDEEEEKKKEKNREDKEDSPDTRTAVKKDVVPFPVAKTQEEWRRLLTRALLLCRVEEGEARECEGCSILMFLPCVSKVASCTCLVSSLCLFLSLYLLGLLSSFHTLLYSPVCLFI